MEILIFTIIWLGISFWIANEGKKREIGYWGSFFVTLFLGFIGIAIVLFSDKLPEEDCNNPYCNCDGNKNNKKK